MSWNNNNLVSRYEYLKALKADKCETMKNIRDFFDPEDGILLGRKKVGLTDQKGELLETTGSDLISEFVSYVLGLHFETSSRWFSMNHMDYDTDSDVQRALEIRSEKLFHLISGTNYYSFIPQHEYDTLVYGHSLMVIERDRKNFANCYVIEPDTVLFEQDNTGEVKEIFFETEYTPFTLFQEIPEFKEKIKDNRALKLAIADAKQTIQVVSYYAPYKEPYFENPEGNFKFAQMLFIKPHGVEGDGTGTQYKFKSKEILDGAVIRKFRENIMFPSRDERRVTTPYGRGVGAKLLPQARILNALMSDLLDAGQYQIDPAVKVSPNFLLKMKSDTTGRRKLRAGQRIPVDGLAEGVNDFEPIQLPLDTRSSLELYRIKQESLANGLPNDGSIYKVSRQSIAEIQGRVSRQEKKLAPIRINYLKESVSRHLERFYQLAEKHGEFRSVPLPERVKLDRMKYIYDSFYISAYRQSRALKITQALSQALNAFSINPASAQYFNGDKVVKEIALAFGVMDVLNSDEEVTAIRRQAEELSRNQQNVQQQQADAQTSKALSDVLSTITEGGGE